MFEKQSTEILINTSTSSFDIFEQFARSSGKLVIQLFDAWGKINNASALSTHFIFILLYKKYLLKKKCDVSEIVR